jgi:PKD repeat protein
MLNSRFSRDCPQGNPPTTAHTFPSTGKVCETFDPYCPTRKLPSNLTGEYKLHYEEYFEFSEAGLHVVAPTDNVNFKPGDFIGYSGAVNLQHKASGVSFRMEPKNPGLYSPAARIEGRTALLRGHYFKYRKLYFNMNKTGEFICTFGNDVASDTARNSKYILAYEEITDVVLNLPNISATNASVFFVVPPHPGGDVKYTFRVEHNETIIIDNQNSSHTLIFNYTFTRSGYYQVDLSVTNIKSSFDISSGIHILDAISNLTWLCPIYARISELTNIPLSAESGENVTCTAQFGDGATITVGPFDFRPGTEHGVPHTYEIAGSYNTSLDVENAVSAVSITGLLIAMQAVCNVTVTVATEFAHTEMPVVLSASVAEGTDVQYLVIFNCTETGIIFPEQPFTGDELVMNFTEPCMYHFKVLAYNNVSAAMYNGSLLVEGTTIVNLRATVGLVIAGEPAVFTAEVDSGAVVNCAWDFGDGARKTLAFGAAVEHVYSTGGKYLLNINCSNSMNSASTSLDIEVLVYITQLDITTHQGGGITGYGPGKNTFPIEDPLLFEFATNCQFVNFTVNFGDLSPRLVTEETSIAHLFVKFGSNDVTVNVSNAISYKVASVSLTLLESVKDVVIDSNGPVKLGEETIFEVTMGQVGTYPCYYFNLGDGSEFIYKEYYLANCPAEYNHVTDIRFITSQVKRSFTHTYANITVYHVTCVGSNLVSSDVAETQAVIVETPCTSPIVSIEGLTQNVDEAREFMRSEEFEVITKNSIDCEATSQTNFEWKVFKVAPEGFSKGESVEVLLPGIKTNDWKIVFQSRSLEYGLYYISFTLTMVGVEGVSSSTFGYVKIIPSPIASEVRGGSTRMVGFDKVILLDGGMSRDPDVEEGDYEGERLDFVFPPNIYKQDGLVLVSSYSKTRSIRDDLYWTSRENSLELIELSSINKVCLV